MAFVRCKYDNNGAVLRVADLFAGLGDRSILSVLSGVGRHFGYAFYIVSHLIIVSRPVASGAGLNLKVCYPRIIRQAEPKLTVSSLALIRV